MLTLGLDTSTRRGSVALGRIADGRVEMLGEESLEVSATHSETVLPAIDSLLAEAGRTAAEIRAVVVGSGPGSFTGVRIAASLARGLCFPGRADLYAYSSLEAIAAVAVPQPGGAVPICALLDARRGQVYAAGYSIDPKARTVARLFAPRALPLVNLLGELDSSAWTFAGVVPVHLQEEVTSAGGAWAAGATYPSGGGLLRLASVDPESGRIDTPSRWEPNYVRGSSAERRMSPG